MATETIVRLIDDMEGGAADTTVHFSLDGVSYEIDLNEINAKKLREALGPFVQNSRKSSPAGAKNGRKSASTLKRTGRDRSSDIREWARTQGLRVNARGRIPASVVEQYDAAH